LTLGFGLRPLLFLSRRSRVKMLAEIVPTFAVATGVKTVETESAVWTLKNRRILVI